MPSERDLDDEEMEIVIVDIADAATGYRASELIGCDVVDDGGARVARVDDIVIARDDDTLFAVLRVGGTADGSGKLVVVPYAALFVNDDGGMLRLLLPGATRGELDAAPAFSYEH